MPADSSDDPLQAIDRQIVALIDERCRTLAQLSEQQGESPPTDWVSQTRSIEELVASLPDSDHGIDRATRTEILRHIASACQRAVRPAAVAFLGPLDTYSHLAAIAFFGDAAPFVPVSSIAAVFESVQRDESRYGIVPIQNSTDGRVVDTLGRLLDSQAVPEAKRLHVIGEVLVPIRHHLSAAPGTTLADVTEVHSKPQAISQCRTWLADHLPAARLVEAASTTAAAQHAAKTPGVAAIASLQAARRYGLEVLHDAIEDQRDNVTRFAVLGKTSPEATGSDKTTLMFQVDHRPGALADVMGIFKSNALNLTWIESFPQPGSPDEYFFIVEFPGHQQDAPVASAIAELEQQTRVTRVLGSYPRANAV